MAGKRTMAEVMAEVETWQNPAFELEKRGIEGSRDDCQACPFAVFFLRETGRNEVASIKVDDTETTVTAPDGSVTVFENPSRMMWFIHDFDAGEYPELDVDPFDVFDDDDWWGDDEEEDEDDG